MAGSYFGVLLAQFYGVVCRKHVVLGVKLQLISDVKKLGCSYLLETWIIFNKQSLKSRLD